MPVFFERRQDFVDPPELVPVVVRDRRMKPGREREAVQVEGWYEQGDQRRLVHVEYLSTFGFLATATTAMAFGYAWCKDPLRPPSPFLSELAHRAVRAGANRAVILSAFEDAPVLLFAPLLSPLLDVGPMIAQKDVPDWVRGRRYVYLDESAIDPFSGAERDLVITESSAKRLARQGP